MACLEGIGLRKGWITTEQLRATARPMAKNQYGQYLLHMADEVEKYGFRAIDDF